jgi:signal transduction histidine kinase
MNSQSLDPKFAQSLVDIIAAELNKNVNIVDKRGIIIASLSKERIGQRHEVGTQMLRSGKTHEFSVTENDQQHFFGVRTGFNVPIWLENECVGLIGITGKSEEAASYARLAAHFVEAALNANVRQEKLVKALQDKQTLHQHYVKKIINIQEEERRKISRELHDETSQALTSIIFGLRVLAKTAHAEEKDKLLQMRDLAADTLEAVHRLAVQLRPVVLDDLGLVSATKKYIEDYAQKYKIKVTAEIAPDLSRQRFSPELEISLYRILQEALTNIIKHAQATEVQINLSIKKSMLLFTVADNGIGFHSKKIHKHRKHACLGLYGMKERIAGVNGEFSIDSTIGQGTCLKIEVPIKTRTPTP